MHVIKNTRKQVYAYSNRKADHGCKKAGDICLKMHLINNQ